jgi:hypothetical protein
MPKSAAEIRKRQAEYMRGKRASRTPEQIERHRLWQRAYRARPENAGQRARDMKKFWSDPKNRARKNLYMRKRRLKFSPEDKLRQADAIRASKLKKKYGLTPGQFVEMFNGQDGKCAACGRGLKLGVRGSGTACIDHDHVTGTTRELLCRGCNSSLGMMEESPEKIAGLLRYAEKWSSKGE